MNGFLHKRSIVVAFFVFLAIHVCGQTARIDSLKNLLTVQKKDELSKTYLELAKEYLNIDPSQTVEFGNKALPLAVEAKDRELEARAEITVGSGLIFTGMFPDGKQRTEKGISIARQIHNAELTCAGLNTLAVYYMNTGEPENALKSFTEALGKAEEANQKTNMAKIHFNIGSIYTNMGKWSKGLEEFNYALEYFKEIKDEQYIVKTLVNIAVNYSYWDDYKKSLEYYEKALAALRKMEDSSGECSVINNIGELYKELGDYEKARTYFSKSLEIAQTLNSPFHQAIPTIGMGEVSLRLGDENMAEQYSMKALELFNKVQMKEGIGRSYRILAEIYFSRKQMQKSLDYALKSKAIADEGEIKDLQEDINLIISDVYRALGNIPQAFDYYRTYSQVRDSLYNEKHSQQLAQLRSELELKEKESEIGLLQKDNQIKDIYIKRQRTQVLLLVSGLFLISFFTVAFYRFNKAKRKVNELLLQKNEQIEKQREELVKLNETKDLFLTIIGHDLRNPIGAFKDSLNQLADYPEMFPEEERNLVIAELRNEAENTYFLLDNLLSWVKSQRDAIQLKTEIFNLNATLKYNVLLHARLADNKGIAFETKVEADYLVSADQNMVSLVLRNLISNAIKFTPENGKVIVSVKRKGKDFVEISVADSGIGVPEEIRQHIFDQHRVVSTYGTNNEKGSGLGLKLCAHFVEMNGGEIYCKTSQGKGSTFSFTLPKSPSVV